MTFDNLIEFLAKLGVSRAIIHDKPFGTIHIVVGSSISKSKISAVVHEIVPVSIYTNVSIDKTIIKNRKKGAYEIMLHEIVPVRTIPVSFEINSGEQS